MLTSLELTEVTPTIEKKIDDPKNKAKDYFKTIVDNYTSPIRKTKVANLS